MVNKEIYTTHKPVPTPEILQHQLKGSNTFTNLDITDCYHQFEIEEDACKIQAFHTPWEIFQYKHMVMRISLASSESQKKIIELIKNYTNLVHMKNDILIHRK